MLSRDELQALIVCRIYAASDSCSSFHINHVEGQIRALVAVLNDGTPPPATGDAIQYLRAAGIPVEVNSTFWSLPDDWARAHGFEWDTTDPSVTPRHPRFSNW